jgi:hypothetical protein
MTYFFKKTNQEKILSCSSRSLAFSGFHGILKPSAAILHADFGDLKQKDLV